VIGVVRWRRSAPGSARRAWWRPRLAGALLAALALVALTFPVLWHNRAAVWEYYAVGHLAGPDREVRAREAGVENAVDALLFYPRVLGQYHLGRSFLLAGLLAVAAAVVLLRVWPRRLGEQPDPRRCGVGGAALFFGLSLLVPAAVLLANPTKSPAVAGILVPPVVGLVLLPLLGLAGRRWPAVAPPLAAGVLAGAAALALAAGLRAQGKALLQPGLLASHREDNDRLVGVYDDLLRYTRRWHLGSPRISFDAKPDYLFPETIQAMLYERHAALVKFQPRLGAGLGAVAPAEAVALVRGSEFVILATPSAADVAVYPFNASMRQLRPRLRELCARDWVLVKLVHVFDRDLRLYARPGLAASRSPGEARPGLARNGRPQRIRLRPE
jgi:hypothetical protein